MAVVQKCKNFQELTKYLQVGQLYKAWVNHFIYISDLKLICLIVRLKNKIKCNYYCRLTDRIHAPLALRIDCSFDTHDDICSNSHIDLYSSALSFQTESYSHSAPSFFQTFHTDLQE